MLGRAKGRRRCDPGPICPLEELPSGGYRPRTIRNVLDADGTLILYQDSLTGGSVFTAEVARTHHKPRYALNLSAAADPSDGEF